MFLHALLNHSCCLLGKHPSSPRTMNEQQTNTYRAMVSQIETMLRSAPQNWTSYLPSARALMQAMDAGAPLALSDRTHFVFVLQELGFVDVDRGGDTHITRWCHGQWLAMLSQRPNSAAVLRGLGTYWLYRAQPSLGRIHAEESSSSSGSSLGAASTGDARLHGANYVEARGQLTPAIDYFSRAVQAAHAEGSLTGELLEKAAEAYMSLGNVTYSRHNRQYFVQAISYLRTATNLPGHRLPEHLQQYLDEYGPLVE
ncbi:uncharacterized protein IWZ02DRAFT_139260 [Phyllosticta citriasiana]|uniref:uncharacterized protein n=1 Tax=Phyllosticta citriasiana TaxID=595635 RepID=UPI0030FDD811